MRKFFRLLDDIRIANRWHLGEILDERSASLELWNGVSIQGNMALKVTVDRPGRALDFSLTNFAAPVAKTALGRAISVTAGPDLQRLPVVVGGKAGYEALNALRVITCLNEEESEFTKWTRTDHRPELVGQYRMVTKLKIDPRRIPPDGEFFRVEGWRIALIVSQAVRNAMEKTGCFGAMFEDVTSE